MRGCLTPNALTIFEREKTFLDRSKGHLELNFDQHGKRDNKKRHNIQTSISNIMFFTSFSKVLKWLLDDFGGAFGVLLGVVGRSWGPLGRLVAVLEASWGCLGVLRNAEERLTMLACV